MDDDVFPCYLVINWQLSSLFNATENYVVQQLFSLNHSLVHDEGLRKTMHRFLDNTTDAQKNEKFKYVFRIVDAPQAVRTGVSFLGGERPVLIGKRLHTHYHRGRNYLEINMDVSSSKVAASISATILSNVHKAVLDLSFLIEAKEQDELPERALCALRINWCTVKDVVLQVDKNGEIVPT